MALPFINISVPPCASSWVQSVLAHAATFGLPDPFPSSDLSSVIERCFAQSSPTVPSDTPNPHVPSTLPPRPASSLTLHSMPPTGSPVSPTTSLSSSPTTSNVPPSISSSPAQGNQSLIVSIPSSDGSCSNEQVASSCTTASGNSHPMSDPSSISPSPVSVFSLPTDPTDAPRPGESNTMEPVAKHDRHSRSLAIIIGSIGGICAMVIFAALVFYCTLKRKHNRQKSPMLLFRRRRQRDSKSPSHGSSPSLTDITGAGKFDSWTTQNMRDVVELPVEGGASILPRSGATAESPTPRLSNHTSQGQTSSTSSYTDVFRDPSSGLPYLWAPTQHNVPSSTPSISSSEIPWQLSIVHRDVQGDPTPEGWSSSEELAPLCSPVVL